MKSVAKDLLQMKNKDLTTRERLLKEGKLSGGYHPEMEKVHRENAAQLRQIIKEIGFPTISKVGNEASEAAWLIIQHSIAEPEFMKHAYQLMSENISDIDLKNLTYLFDRIQYFQGAPQKYGTQFNADGSIYPVLDKYELNNLRTLHHLPLLSQTEIDRIAPIEDIERIENRNPDYILWRKHVGWK
jgi:hypothetical protein